MVCGNKMVELDEWESRNKFFATRRHRRGQQVHEARPLQGSAGGCPGGSADARPARDGLGDRQLQGQPNLKPDEYLLKSIGVRVGLGEARPAGTRKTITGPKRRRILERDGHACQVCGVAAGAEFPDTLGRRATLTIGHIIPVARGGADDEDNLRAECQRCNDEARDVSSDPPTPGEVLARATSVGGVKEKRALYGWMQAGRRTADDKEKIFNDWVRLPHEQRLRVMADLASQVIKDLDQ
ncbi:MAG TPA: HNH endonuclease [Jatrophihabitantaceae bacterium]|nr:HNH endonuclease [Jatrophihabitantaceae bacterium]